MKYAYSGKLNVSKKIENFVKPLLIFCSFFFVILFMIFAGCNRKSEKHKASVKKIFLPVKVIRVKRGTIEEYLTYSGSIDAVKRTAIAPSVPARIEKIYVEEGEKVRKGKVLVRMDDKQLIQSKATFSSVESDYNRMKVLRQRGTATAQQFDQIEAGYEAAKAGYEMMKENAILTAPFSGVIIGKYYNEGEIYSSMKPGPSGVGAILSLARLDRMKIEVNVPEQDFVKIEKGQSVIVKADALGNTSFIGNVQTVNQALDLMSRTARITVEIKNSDKILKPGMFSRVKIIINKKDSTLVVPTNAIVRRGEKSFVFTVPSGTTPYQTKPASVEVKTGLHSIEYTEIEGTISENDLVIVENNTGLQSETLIEVTEIVKAIGEK